MTRDINQVKLAIASERAYQDSLWGETKSSDRDGNGERSIIEFTSYTMGYAEKLFNITSVSSNPMEKLDFVRKVAGLCMAALEQHAHITLANVIDDFKDIHSQYSIDEFAFIIKMKASGLADFVYLRTTLPNEMKESNAVAKNTCLKAILEILTTCCSCMLQHGAPMRLQSINQKSETQVLIAYIKDNQTTTIECGRCLRSGNVAELLNACFDIDIDHELLQQPHSRAKLSVDITSNKKLAEAVAFIQNNRSRINPGSTALTLDKFPALIKILTGDDVTVADCTL